MIAQGLVLMAIGMGMVFVFLVVLIKTMDIMSALIKPLARLIPEPEEKVVVKAKKVISEDHEDVAIAIAAVKSFVK